MAVVGLSLVALRYRPVALNNVSDRLNLQDYIEERCELRQTKIKDSASAYHVVRKTVNQFYIAWMMVWLVWSIYYGLDIYLYVIGKDVLTVRYFDNLRYLLDFLSSSFLFAVYFILNDVTVNISNRAGVSYSNLYYAIVSCVFILFIGVILQMTYMMHYWDSAFCKYELYTKALLSLFGTISFVFVLGKFNSNYLSIPRFLMMPLYIYAVAQSYVLFYDVNIEYTTKMREFAPGDYGAIVYVVKILMPWIISFGKISLLVLLSWILYKRRLIFYIIHRSVSMTETPRMVREFNRYMNK